MNIGQTIFNNLKQKFYNPNRTDKFEVLFCPYKESMWDSMQTIYETALEDSDTYTEIMPIPYFSLVADRPNKAKQEFPKFYNNFPDALNDKWDIIIFHYPYDRLNNVTRPMIVSTDLKGFCKHLVSVGYACVGDRLPSVSEVLLPGNRNSDVIITETEEQAKVCKEILKQHLPNNKTEVFGWGSAKYDCLEKKYPIPDEWLEKTEYRKVILLQTSLVPYLNNREKLTQIEQIINKYSRNNKICLMWRPHPLLEETIKAHRPSDLKKWYELTDRVASSDKDILDRTNELHRAIYMSDEMISDKSSVAILYQKTGKKLTILER